MSSSMDNLAKDLLMIMNETNEKKPTPYETRATVVRNDEEDPNIVWVHIPGGEPETPITKTINAEKGDTVIVSVANGRGRVVGNVTDPPASGSTVKEVTKLVQGAYTSIENLEERLESGEFDLEAEFIEDSWLEYALSSSNSEFIPVTGGDDEDPEPEPSPDEGEEESDPGHYEDGWSQSLPEYQPGYFYWMRTVTKLVLERVEEEEEEDEEYEDENLEPQEDEGGDEEGGDEEEEDYILVFGEPRFYLAGQLAAESNYLYNKDIRHYFWHDDTGAYVTTSEDDYTDGFATHIISGSMELLYNGNPCTKWLPSGVAFYGAADGEYTDEIVASFGVGGIQFSDTVPFWIGNSNNYIQWDSVNNKIRIVANEIIFGGVGLDLTIDGLEQDIDDLSDEIDAVDTKADNAASSASSAYSLASSAYSTASNLNQHFTFSSSYGARVLSDSNNYTQINSGGMSIYVGGTSVAEYSNVVRVGSTSGYNMKIQSDEFDFCNGSTIYGYIDFSNYGLNFTSSGRTISLDAKTVTIDASSSAVDAVNIGSASGSVSLFSVAASVHLGKQANSFSPDVNNKTSLGSSNYLWSKLYAKSGTIDTSDLKEKDIVGKIDFAEDLIYGLEPIEYYWKDGDHRREHMGFIAQDVSEQCKALGLNLYLYTASYKSNDDKGDEPFIDYFGEDVDDELLAWGLSYTQLIAPMVKVIQNQNDRITKLERRLDNAS